MKRQTFKTTGRVKWCRPDGDGYIIPDESQYQYIGKNIKFDSSIVTGLNLGDQVTVTYRELLGQLCAVKIINRKAKK